MGSDLNNKVLRNSNDAELVTYFRGVLRYVGNKSVSDHLLAGIYSEALPLRILPVWLNGFANEISLAAALQYEHSITARKIAIKRFGRRLKGRNVAGLWDAIGGTQGLIDLFQRLSVHDVALFCRMLARSSTWSTGQSARRERLTELLKGLASDYFLDTQYENSERRPLLRYYSFMVPACTTDMVQAWQQNDTLPQPDGYRLYQAHPYHFQGECVRRLRTSKDETFSLPVYEPLMDSLPPLPANKEMSESMRFSLGILVYLEKSRNTNVLPAEIFSKIAHPLLRRLERRRSTSGVRFEVLRLLVSYMQARPSLSEQLSLCGDETINHAVRLWNLYPNQQDETLVSLIELIPRDKSATLCDVADILDKTSARHRYRLLTILLQHLQHFGMHLSDDDDLKRCKDKWPVQVFLSLPRDEAHRLLERLVLLRSADTDGFLGWYKLGNQVPSIFSCLNIDVLELYLSQDKPDMLEKVQNIVAKHRQTAAKSREQTERLSWAKVVICCAIASGSLDLFEETLMWARRFNKDPLTVRELYADTTVHAKEALDLISGLSTISETHAVSALQFQESVKYGNRIMLLLLETACQCLCEPSFNRSDWNHVLKLFDSVTRLRIKGSLNLKQRLHLSEQELYDIVWRHTLDTLIQAERIGLQEGCQNLQFNRLGGPLSSHWAWAHLKFKTFNPASCRFIDNLAERRNELWESYRQAVHPSVVTLENPWTHGLPMQALLPFDRDFSGYVQDMPFLFQRACDTVFMEPTIALGRIPEDDDTTNAIGAFVDDYRAALHFFVRAHKSSTEQIRSANEAWDYAFKSLTGRRMNEMEAVGFWKDVFQRAGADLSQSHSQGAATVHATSSRR